LFRGRDGDECDRKSPRRVIGTASAKPASGPAAPISMSVLRSGIGSRREMKAPNVPKMTKGGGMGMKKGRDASTFRRRATR
jgi:hypothetical protein